VKSQPEPEPAEQPVVLASVPMPTPAPQPKIGEAPPEQPKSIAGLLGNLFAAQPQAEPVAAPQPAQQPAPRTQVARAKRPAVMQTASMPTPAVKHETKPAQEAKAQPAPAQAAPAARQTPAPELRTAYQSTQSNNNSLLSGAQPLVPAGSFENRWTALR
jgi:hypothetical protein